MQQQPAAESRGLDATRRNRSLQHGLSSSGRELCAGAADRGYPACAATTDVPKDGVSKRVDTQHQTTPWNPQHDIHTRLRLPFPSSDHPCILSYWRRINE